MSTRATYGFTGALGPSTVFYIHHDGYLEGAADYLLEAAKRYLGAPGGTLAEAFIRANECAEIAHSHGTHADTDYRYEVTLGAVHHVLAWKRVPSSGRWEVAFSGSLADFITKYARVQVIQRGSRLYTKELAVERAERMAQRAEQYAADHPGMTGNIAAARQEANGARALADLFA